MLSDLPGVSRLSGLFPRLRSLWRSLRRRSDVDAEMLEEFHHHIELRTEELIRRGMEPAEAARRARVEFGGIDGHREDARAARGLRPFDEIRVSWLDVKIGLRMLLKYPGLSLVSIFGMAVAIAVGAGGFGVIHAAMDTELPLEDGGRLVVVRGTGAGGAGDPGEPWAADFLGWRSELATVRDVGAFRTEQRVIVDQERVVPVARITASGFRVARVAAAMGRPLLDEDERPGAAPVVVIAHEEWEHRFASDPEIVGREIRLEGEVRTVVGVMPEGFRFPVNHRYWVPLATEGAAAGDGTGLTVFGRLADGATLAQAGAEAAAIAGRIAGARPETHEYLRLRVLPYARAMMGIDGLETAWLLRTAQIALSLLLVVVSVNVALLVYARTAARMGEITIRTALGASRRRVVSQLFAEALVLSLLATAMGLVAAALGFDWFVGLATGGDADQLPFWVDAGLSPAVVVYAAGLALLAGVIVGVLPALRATGRGVQAGLQQLHSGGPGLRLGRTWSALILVQVAMAVAVLPYALYVAGPSITRGLASPGYPVGEMIHASLALEEGLAEPDTTRFPLAVAELQRRLEAEPEVAGVAFATRFPGTEEVVEIEIEGGKARRWAWLNRVGPELFSTFDVPILAGRAFVGSDATSDPSAVVVDRVFAEHLLDGGEVLGRRVRLVSRTPGGAAGGGEAGPWLEIVGIVPEFVVPPAFQREAPKMYRPLSLAHAGGRAELAVRLRPEVSTGSYHLRVRELAASTDPALRFVKLRTGEQSERERKQGLLVLALVVVAVTGSVLLLSAAGIYAMMSFTVARRRREIGIRAALGARPRHVVGSILKRAGRQLGLGALAGLAVSEAVALALGGSFLTGEGVVLLPAVAGLMMCIGLLAAWAPVRRGLAVSPTEALRDE